MQALWTDWKFFWEWEAQSLLFGSTVLIVSEYLCAWCNFFFFMYKGINFHYDFFHSPHTDFSWSFEACTSKAQYNFEKEYLKRNNLKTNLKNQFTNNIILAQFTKTWAGFRNSLLAELNSRRSCSPSVLPSSAGVIPFDGNWQYMVSGDMWIMCPDDSNINKV